ncbi:MAG: hypothetical protein ACHWZW_19705 [Spirulina sp.]
MDVVNSALGSSVAASSKIAVEVATQELEDFLNGEGSQENLEKSISNSVVRASTSASEESTISEKLNDFLDD